MMIKWLRSLPIVVYIDLYGMLLNISPALSQFPYLSIFYSSYNCKCLSIDVRVHFFHIFYLLLFSLHFSCTTIQFYIELCILQYFTAKQDMFGFFLDRTRESIYHINFQHISICICSLYMCVQYHTFLQILERLSSLPSVCSHKLLSF